MSKSTLNQRIQQFYDQSTQLWLDTWGEHMHHGHYGIDGTLQKDHRQAQVDLIKELLRWGEVSDVARVLDAGCGVGGSARYLAKRFGADVLGVTLSPVQVQAAKKLTQQNGLQNKVNFQARDMMTINQDDGSFDLVWSLESAEHMVDKQGLMNNFYQLLSPGGNLLMATWCHRNEPPDLTLREQKHLGKLYRIYNLPPMVSASSLGQKARRAGFQQVQTEDWSSAVAPFWQAVIRSALEWQNFRRLLNTGWDTLKGAWAMQYMKKGYQRGLIRFVVLKGRKNLKA